MEYIHIHIVKKQWSKCLDRIPKNKILGVEAREVILNRDKKLLKNLGTRERSWELIQHKKYDCRSLLL